MWWNELLYLLFTWSHRRRRRVSFFSSSTEFIFLKIGFIKKVKILRLKSKAENKKRNEKSFIGHFSLYSSVHAFIHFFAHLLAWNLLKNKIKNHFGFSLYMKKNVCKYAYTWTKRKKESKKNYLKFEANIKNELLNGKALCDAFILELSAYLGC